MKKILFRKLTTDYLSFAFLSLISASIVIWVFQAVNHLDIMIEDGRDYLVYLKFTSLNFPKIFTKILPFVLFFSIFYITNKYEVNNELIIYWNFGVSKFQIVNYVFKISILLMLMQIFLTSYIVPHTQDLARSFLRSSTVNFYGNFIKSQKFNDTIKGVTIYSEKKDKKGNLYNLYLKKEIGKNEFQITYAKKGEFKEIGNNPILVLFEGATITSKDNNVTNISFSKSDFSLSNLETNTTTYKKTQEISSLKLVECTKNYFKFDKENFETNSKNIENCSTENISNIFKELYKRFVIPFYIPLLSLIPFILILTSKESLNFNKVRIFTFLIGLLAIIFSETTIRLVSNKIFQNISLVVIPLLFILLIYFFLFYKFKLNYKN